MDAVNRILRTAAQVLAGAGGTAIIALVFTSLPTAAVAVIFAGLTIAATVLHNVVPTLTFFEKFFPARDQHYFVDAEDIAGHLEDIVGELSAHLPTPKSVAAPVPTVPAVVDTSQLDARTPVPDVAGGDVAAVNPNVLHREATNVPTA